MSSPEVIVDRLGEPLMTLSRYAFDPERLNFQPAYAELKQRTLTSADESHTWGYFPELNPSSEEYPESGALARSLQAELFDLHPDLWWLGYKLAFIRVATAEPQSKFGGLHVDVQAGIGHSREPGVAPDKEIVRLLLNPYAAPRMLGYVALTRHELQEIGIVISNERYQILQLPDDIPTEAVEIPPVEEEAIYGLQFYSSLLPHAGITDSRGHYLIAYGAYTNNPFSH